MITKAIYAGNSRVIISHKSQRRDENSFGKLKKKIKFAKSNDKVHFNNLKAKYFQNKLLKRACLLGTENENFALFFENVRERELSNLIQIAFGAAVINFCSYNLDSSENDRNNV